MVIVFFFCMLGHMAKRMLLEKFISLIVIYNVDTDPSSRP